MSIASAVQRKGVPDATPDRTVPGMGVWRPFQGPLQRWPQLTDALLAAAALALTLASWSWRASQPILGTFTDIGVFLAGFVACLALLWRRSHPWQVHAVVVLTGILLLFAPSIDGLAPLALSLYSLGRYETDSRISTIAASGSLVFLAVQQGLPVAPGVSGVVTTAVWVGLWYAGRRLRFRGEYLRLLEDRAAQLEREQHVEAERAVVAERNRVAREMHDVVAHKLSLMTVQAGAARTVGASDPDAALDAMAAVETAGRDAMAEMRDLLGVLRPAGQEKTLGPQPGIADLPALVREVRDAGLTVHLATTGPLAGLPSRLQLSVYRIVQEALTNVMKHAGEGVQVAIAIERRNDCVVVSVNDNGVGSDPGKTGGQGITGMRERAELLGGSLRAAEGSDGGFVVHAELPIEVVVR
ncbi:MAG: sensor histidine kinase [Pseudomonadota bacterium]